MRQISMFLAAALLLAACSIRKSPKKPFSAYEPSPVPDYSLSTAWSALPGKDDYADRVPPEVSPEAQATAAADVFFIHPTTFMGGLAWNANVKDRELNAKTDERAIKHQASAFNASGRVFAPRYRQMAFGGFFSDDTVSEKLALKLAYQDVRSAFQYYLDHHNQGRPIVIASHSQGSIHGIQLIKEFFDGKALQEQLVAAYLLGWPFPAQAFESVPVCDAPDQTACVIGWCSWRDGVIPKEFDSYYKGAVVVNPLSWRADNKRVAESQHDGFLKGNFKSIKRQSLYAEAHDGILWVKNPLPLAPVKNYHIGDVNLFWLDIRENVAERVAAFLKE
ncbi:MAG: DUF3089 domain-containing protein [Bacteroidota bacterium]